MQLGIAIASIVFADEMFRKRSKNMSNAGQDVAPKVRSLVGPMLAVGAVLIGSVALWQSGFMKSKPSLVLITSSTDSYYTTLIDGALVSANRYGVNLSVIQPNGGEAEQTKAMLDASSSGIDGIAISAIDNVKQADAFATVSAKTSLVTLDSDCDPKFRVCFVGADNYSIGRTFGELVKQALPDGGRIVISAATLSRDNLDRRRQGVIDELLDRSFLPSRESDAKEGASTGSKYVVAETLVDDFSEERATQLITTALSGPTPADCIVGIDAYAGKAALKAVAAANRGGKTAIIASDVSDELLAAVEAGSVFGIVVQDQYTYGFEAIRILAAIEKGEREMGMPLTTVLNIPVYVVTKDRVSTYREMQKRNREGVAPQ